MGNDVSNVVSLKGFKKEAAPRQEWRQKFPKIYRRTGRLKNGIEMPTGYTFAIEEPEWLDRAKTVEIARLDPDIDDGWLVVRRHASLAELKGYLSCQMDMLGDEISQTACVHSDETGVYSLTCREPPLDSPDHLLIFVHSVEADQYSIEAIDQPDFYTICYSDGTVSHDIAAMYPFLKDTLINV